MGQLELPAVEREELVCTAFDNLIPTAIIRQE